MKLSFVRMLVLALLALSMSGCGAVFSAVGWTTPHTITRPPTYGPAAYVQYPRHYRPHHPPQYYPRGQYPNQGQRQIRYYGPRHSPHVQPASAYTPPRKAVKPVHTTPVRGGRGGHRGGHRH